MPNYLNTLGSQLWNMIHKTQIKATPPSAAALDLDGTELSEHALRDIGVLDGRISPSTARHHAAKTGSSLDAARENPPHSF